MSSNESRSINCWEWWRRVDDISWRWTEVFSRSRCYYWDFTDLRSSSSVIYQMSLSFSLSPPLPLPSSLCPSLGDIDRLLCPTTIPHPASFPDSPSSVLLPSSTSGDLALNVLLVFLLPVAYSTLLPRFPVFLFSSYSLSSCFVASLRRSLLISSLSSSFFSSSSFSSSSS